MTPEEIDAIMAEALNPTPHPCDSPGCTHMVQYDDEPYCFTHSPDSGSSVSGYSWKREHAS